MQVDQVSQVSLVLSGAQLDVMAVSAPTDAEEPVVTVARVEQADEVVMVLQVQALVWFRQRVLPCRCRVQVFLPITAL